MELNLNDNYLSVLENGIFGCLHKLVHLDIGTNLLHDIPSQALAALYSLQYINMD